MASQELTAFPAKGKAKASPIRSKVKQNPGRLHQWIRVDRTNRGAIHGQDKWLFKQNPAYELHPLPDNFNRKSFLPLQLFTP